MKATTTMREGPIEAQPRLALPGNILACLFDLDGVLTDTAGLHVCAWKETFDAFLLRRAVQSGERFVPFDAVLDYGRYVDGRPRLDGVRAFLASRRLDLADDDVVALGEQKNELVLDLLRSEGVQPYQGSVRFARAARDAGLRLAVVSSSANCADVLAAAGISDLFELRVDGVYTRANRLPGKPAPDAYLAAAAALCVQPADAAVFEDALAGVAAGRAGGFGLVVGVDRGGHAEALLTAGADLVVPDLSDLLS
jgi:beta-phosphoglucomutase family hydrolase